MHHLVHYNTSPWLKSNFWFRMRVPQTSDQQCNDNTVRGTYTHCNCTCKYRHRNWTYTYRQCNCTWERCYWRCIYRQRDNSEFSNMSTVLYTNITPWHFNPVIVSQSSTIQHMAVQHNSRRPDLHHDVVTVDSLLCLIHPTLHHIIVLLSQQLATSATRASSSSSHQSQ